MPDHDPVDLPKGANAILVTHDLTPSLTVQLDREAIAAIATDAGTRTSHVAILARSLGLPAIVGSARRDAAAQTGARRRFSTARPASLAINPTADEIATYQRARAREEQLAEEPSCSRSSRSSITLTTDGVRITLRANVDLPEEAELAARSGAEGVGLMRTEFLVVGRATMPDEEEQYRAYTRVVEAFGGAPVVIRTFDIGGDKLPVGGFPTEANPFLGWRAIRMCLDQPELFSVQLRALLRAAVHGDVRIMLPLVVHGRRSARGARAARRERRAELEARGVPHSPRRAARRDDRDAGRRRRPRTRFVGRRRRSSASARTISCSTRSRSIAATRTSRRASRRCIRRCCGSSSARCRWARANEIDVAVCGEMASQPLMAFALIGLGVRQLSVAPRSVPLVKRIVRGIYGERGCEERARPRWKRARPQRRKR